ncbi:hypothetical protein PG2023B_1544 [Bifidobacterium pseudolongum subsp. globosum]|nr:hypothetical protein PG2023B_1544 [Bifidobacterium pseudolongum subsp. globosum]
MEKGTWADWVSTIGGGAGGRSASEHYQQSRTEREETEMSRVKKSVRGMAVLSAIGLALGLLVPSPVMARACSAV